MTTANIDLLIEKFWKGELSLNEKRFLLKQLEGCEPILRAELESSFNQPNPQDPIISPDVKKELFSRILKDLHLQEEPGNTERYDRITSPPVKSKSAYTYKRKNQNRHVEARNRTSLLIDLVHRFRTNLPGKVAAAVFFLLIPALVWRSYQNSRYVIVKPGKQQLTKVILPDESRIWLKKGGEVRYLIDFKSDKREVFLLGDAFFSIKKESSRPFIVKVSDLEIQVLGTSFDIKSDLKGETVATTLVRGSVDVRRNNHAQHVPATKLAPYERVTYTRNTGAMTHDRRVPYREVSALDLEEQENLSMVFSDLPFSDVIGRLERRFNVEIRVQDDNDLSCLFTGNFEKESLQEILDIIAISHRITYTHQDEEILIKGSICSQ